ncbi:HEPN domain-containing protein [Williamsia sp. CHRR-6]|uniref:ApeA N-terminal domain 1-containing protein n=1 Tax=Williamsia sp. CHRR-6 TaxID=2835871 RepID=UPI001BDA751C|nr:HEPN domain-containing protein [Williamsia sp. CHRR-6]MBT0568612.1 hypothetical protein [Williamsia sp. CHRR-6]
MAFERFPDPTPESIGQFQMVDAAGDPLSPVRTGILRFTDDRAVLEVSPGFTPTIKWVEQPDGNGLVGSHVDEPAESVVLGSLAVNPNQVTLWGVNTTRRRSVGFSLPGQDAPGNQVMRTDWCLVGDHVADPGTTFGEVRVNVTNLHEWAGISTTSQTMPLDGKGPRSWTLDLPDSPTAALVDQPGQLRLVPQATMSPPEFGGFRVSTNTTAVITVDTAPTLPDALHRLATPIATLMTLLSGAESSVRRVEVKNDDVRVEVFGYQVATDAPESAGDLLLYRSVLGDEFLPRWLELAQRVTPVPQILAAAWSDEFTTIDTEALTLATVAEMLHRRLYPAATRFSDGQIAQATEALRESQVDDAVKDSLIEALQGWWAEESYPQRLKQLAEPVAAAVPSAVGKIGRWKEAVRAQRVAAAHGLGEDDAGAAPDILEVYALTQSLRWVLTFRLLLEAGVTPDQLATAAEQSERYRNAVRLWNERLPRIYAE